MRMVVKNASPHLERLRKLLADQRGVLLTADLARLHIPRTYLSMLVRSGEIEPVARGVYRATTAIEDELFSLQAIYKRAIYSHYTALYLHDLSDRSPLAHSLTLPSGYHSPALQAGGYKIFYLARHLLPIGVITLPSPHGNPLRVTNLERTVCDILRSRNQIDIHLVYDALKRYAQRRDRDIDRLYRYAEQFALTNVVRDYLEVLL